jgi:predicted nucleic acid-binding protein
MIVLDASVLAVAVGDDEHAGQAARARLAAEDSVAVPDLADVETVSVLRERWRHGDIAEDRFRDAIDDLAALPLVRYPVGPLMTRAFDLRHDVTPYDACYVALAEALGCVLFSADAKLTRAPGIRCELEIFAP